jgi:hypothetical protein
VKPGQERDANGRLKKKDPPAPVLLPPGDGDELAAMRWVLTHADDATELHRSMRAWLKEDRPGFMRAFMATANKERKPATEAVQAIGQRPAVPDLGTERCVELARDLLARLGERPTSRVRSDF